MIQINLKNRSYTCPFCGHEQAYWNSCHVVDNQFSSCGIPEDCKDSTFSIYTFHCQNKECGKRAVTAINRTTGKQVDIVPQVSIRYYPQYIPEQIRKDYEEASMILDSSPKAAATLLRRCLQGMVRDFWGIKKGNLNAELSELKDKIPAAQWKAIDGLRKIGNIGAHMEKDVNLIVDIDTNESTKLLKLIELLFDKWYIARHDEEQLYAEITDISDEKAEMRK